MPNATIAAGMVISIGSVILILWDLDGETN